MSSPAINPALAHTKADVARENGAKSHGPATPEGRSISCMNAVKHSLTAKTVVLSVENQQDFIRLSQSYEECWHPANIVEVDLVEEMAVAKWQEKRCYAMETALLNLTMQKHQNDPAMQVENLDEISREALAFMELSDESNGLRLLHRYRAEHTRDYHRAVKQMIALRTKGTLNKEAPAEKRNEPTAKPNSNTTKESPLTNGTAQTITTLPLTGTWTCEDEIIIVRRDQEDVFRNAA